MGNDHYFSNTPGTPETRKTIQVILAGKERDIITANGIFSPDRIDIGTGVLLTDAPLPPAKGQLLDLGCGWGPITLSLALHAPHSTVWAVDVNERALSLVRMNAERLGLTNINACTPDEVPKDLRFDAIWSNPPIRIGKNELHGLLSQWIPRLSLNREAWLVVQRNLGADSLQRWLQAELATQFDVQRFSSSKGYRVLRVRRKA